MTNEEAIETTKTTIPEIDWDYPEWEYPLNVVMGILKKLSISNAYDMPSFYYNNKKDYKVIPTKYHKGYMRALEDVGREIRMQLGLAERNVNITGLEPYKKEDK